MLLAFQWALKSSDIALAQYNSKNNPGIKLSPNQIEALLKIEDPSFWQNSGIDIHHRGQGKTEMTQSIVPILLYRAELQGWRGVLQKFYASFWSKFKKIDLGRDIMALAVSKKVSKKMILQIFLDQAYSGTIKNNSIFGFSEASKSYFGKEIKSLDEGEIADLVGM